MTKFGLNKERKVFLSSKEKGCEIIYTFFSGSIFLWQLTEIALGLFIFFHSIYEKKKSKFMKFIAAWRKPFNKYIFNITNMLFTGDI